MKIRNGFVSNSSSSSFIVRDKDAIEQAKKIIEKENGDYCIVHNKLFTPIYSDESDIYRNLQDSDIFDSYAEGKYGEPYGETLYVRLHGKRYEEDIYILQSEFTEEELTELGNPPYSLAVQMYNCVKKHLITYDAEDNFDVDDFISECRYILQQEDKC